MGNCNCVKPQGKNAKPAAADVDQRDMSDFENKIVAQEKVINELKEQLLEQEEILKDESMKAVFDDIREFQKTIRVQFNYELKVLVKLKAQKKKFDEA